MTLALGTNGKKYSPLARTVLYCIRLNSPIKPLFSGPEQRAPFTTSIILINSTVLLHYNRVSLILCDLYLMNLISPYWGILYVCSTVCTSNYSYVGYFKSVTFILGSAVYHTVDSIWERTSTGCKLLQYITKIIHLVVYKTGLVKSQQW